MDFLVGTRLCRWVYRLGKSENGKSCGKRGVLVGETGVSVDFLGCRVRIRAKYGLKIACFVRITPSDVGMTPCDVGIHPSDVGVCRENMNK
jgi:hypothetical protein